MTLFFPEKFFLLATIWGDKSFQPYLDEAKKDGIYPLWVPYIFCGMPSFASLLSAQDRVYDLTSTIVDIVHRIFTGVLRNDAGTTVMFYYFIFGVSMYFFMVHKKKSPVAALFTALATLFSTYVIILIRW